VLLSGNPRLLDPVCQEFLHRGAAVAWLYDRFSLGCFRRWHRQGVGQLVCDSSLGRIDPFPTELLGRPLFYRGIDLAPVVECWYRRLRRSLARSQGRLWTEVGRQVAAFRPTHAVVDEDATPQARAVVAHARRLGAASAVVQHGICGVRFGFAPLAADRFCAWDEGSRKQLAAWGVSSHRIAVTGSPYQERIVAEAARPEQAPPNRSLIGDARNGEPESAPRVLLVGTIPPRDDRPDSVAYHLTSRNYEHLLEAALSAVDEIPHREFAVRNHPRAGVDRTLGRLLAARPGLRFRDTSRRPIAADLADADIVLSFPSSGALDAVRLGKPVIQLVPTDSHDVASADWYGFFGSAGTLPELRRLLAALLHSRPQRTRVDLASGGAAGRIVDVVLEPLHPLTPRPHIAARPTMPSYVEAIR
jgi:hypothetical protein